MIRLPVTVHAPVRILAASVAAVIALAVITDAEFRTAKPPAVASSNSFTGLVAGSEDAGRVAPDRSLSVLLMLRQGLPAQDLEGQAARLDGYFAAAGLATTWHTGHRWLTVAGPARHLERVFDIDVHQYRSRDGVRFAASMRDPIVPTELRSIVAGTGHVSTYAAAAGPSVPAGGLRAVDMLNAYDMKPLRDLGLDGSGETVVFFEGFPIGGYKQADLDVFAKREHLPPFVVTQRTPLTGTPPSAVEAQMDLEIVHAIAPGAKLVVYTMKEPASADDLLALQDRMVSENPGAIAVIEWSTFEDSVTKAQADAWASVYDRADQLGETVLVPSFDDGAFGGLNSDWGAVPSESYLSQWLPTTMPGVTSVGGTRISVRRDGTWYNETVWEDPAGTAGSGGGLARYIPMPTWQKAPGTANRFSNGMREVPDISADADPVSGASIFLSEFGGWTTGGGTSQSGPILAGAVALINQYLKRNGLKPVGFLNPALYSLATGHPAYPPFHDITVGTNLYYPATPGYDLATGLGTPDVWNLARDLESLQRRGS